MLAECFALDPRKLTLQAYIESRNKLRIYLCCNDRIVRELDPGELLSAQLIGLRLDSEAIKNLLLSLHHAFMGELMVDKRERLSLLIYESPKVGCTCVGILLDEKPQKVLQIPDVFEAVGVGNEQLN